MVYAASFLQTPFLCHFKSWVPGPLGNVAICLESIQCRLVDGNSYPNDFPEDICHEGMLNCTQVTPGLGSQTLVGWLRCLLKLTGKVVKGM